MRHKLRWQLATCRQFFGPAKLERVLEELQTYSDFALHEIARGSPHYSHLCLEDESIMRSGKCCLLAELLPQLQVAPAMGGDDAASQALSPASCICPPALLPV